MKQNFAPNAELGELLALLQETVQVCGKHLTDRVICQCTGMSSKTYTALKGAPFQTSCRTIQWYVSTWTNLSPEKTLIPCVLYWKNCTNVSNWIIATGSALTPWHRSCRTFLYVHAWRIHVWDLDKKTLSCAREGKLYKGGDRVSQTTIFWVLNYWISDKNENISSNCLL